MTLLSKTKRLPEIAVGDMIQYRYSYGPKGFTQWTQSTRKVVEVIDGGATFVVEGFFNVPAGCVITHIPMGRSEEQ